MSLSGVTDVREDVEDVVLEVDATYGTLVTPGQRIRRGEPVGYAPPAPWPGQPAYPVAVTAPVGGRVTETSFVSDRHRFLVRIRPDREQPPRACR